MEISCPTCSQRLRYSDELVNPMLRCRNCLTTFRPNQLHSAAEEPVTAVAVEESNPDLDGSFRRLNPETFQPATSDSRSGGWFGKSGAGSIGIIALLIFFKAGPRLLRELLRDRKPDRPVQMRHEDQQAVEKKMREAVEKAATWKKIQPLPVPGEPRHVLPEAPPDL